MKPLSCTSLDEVVSGIETIDRLRKEALELLVNAGPVDTEQERQVPAFIRQMQSQRRAFHNLCDTLHPEVKEMLPAIERKYDIAFAVATAEKIITEQEAAGRLDSGRHRM